MTEIERAIKYIQTAGGAISGSGGHNHTFGLACNLFKNFKLSAAEILSLMEQHHNPHCQPAWSEKELRHKVENAAKAESYQGLAVEWTGTGTAKAPHGVITPVKKSTGIKYIYKGGDAKRPLPDEIEDGARKLIRTCFREGEGVRLVHPDLNEEGKEVPDQGMCFSREFWLKKLDSREGKVNDGGFLSKSGNPGVYVGINPLKEGETLDKHVTEYRHALLEFDELDIEKQWQLYHQSELPIAAVIHSGGRSLHAWVKVDAKDRQEYDERVATIYEFFADHNPDTKNKNPGRLSRFPNCIRMGSRQKLLALDIGKNSFSEWLADRTLDGIGKPIDIDELMAFTPTDDPNNILGDRWLCKGASCILVAPSGVGKSTLAAQASFTWALGRDLFGIRPVRPLKSLIIQAENDLGDIAEQTQGVVAGMGIDMFDDHDEFETLRNNVRYVRDSIHTGKDFANALHRLIDRHKPDLVWIDPLLSFIGGDLSRQDVCSHFLRNLLNPIAEATGVIFMMIHHTGKPPKDAKAMSNWNSSDFAYLGNGSSELTNWARAVCVLQQVEEGMFQLMLAKRGGRAGALDMDGKRTQSIYMSHSQDGSIRWIQEATPAFVEQEKEKKKNGRPEVPFEVEDWLEDIEGQPMKYSELLKSALNFSRLTGGPKERKMKDILKTLRVDKRIEKQPNGTWMHEKSIL